ncbi:PUS7 [[Candida] subhashii]|uniref:PUS7 n=1 Tax=[Candida] subhashii TaxID=561895 RepID=A0A8J5QT80_9ASCO|nr:PUS7 [[Candida] subhashii]KAG7662275.1 PUS7 [[Candida] subhashii]
MSDKRAISESDISTSSQGETKKPKVLQSGLREPDVGITQFINPNAVGFTGYIKTLYSDFQVNEIDTSGKVIHLEDKGIDVGKSSKEKRLEEREKQRAELEGKTQEEIQAILAERKAAKEAREAKENELPKYELSEEHRTEILKYFTPEELAQIEELFKTGNNMETKSSFDDKDTRTTIHKLIRAAFQGKLETITSPENTFKIAMSKKSSRKPRPDESMHHVDENGVINYGAGKFKPYLHFTVFKANRDTMDIANNITRLLRIPKNQIKYAGTKDRRGVTCQRLSVEKGKVLRINSLNKALAPNIILGGFKYEDYSLGLGELKGNEFIITIRDVSSECGNVEKVVEEGFESLKEHGFINYFGMQRFGSFAVPTHILGIQLINENWKSFVDMLIGQQLSVDNPSFEARKIWTETRDAAAAVKTLPHYFVAESCILKSLSKDNKNKEGEYADSSYFQSIMAIPRNLKRIYVHAYQSYVWNTVASKRIEMFGLELQEGDLVIDDDKLQPDADLEEEDIANRDDIKVKPLTKEDIDSGKYTIFDIILPTPGFKITYPTNESLMQVYIDVMAKDNLNPFKLARKNQEFSLPGSYRKVMSKPTNLSYEIVHYSNDKAPIVRTDLEMLDLKKGEGEEEPSRIIQSEGDKKAVVVKMALGVSSYATMALRELMRMDTTRFGETMK